MNIDIKKSWFHANWNKPKRMNKKMKRYMKKYYNVKSILSTADQYSLEIPQISKGIIQDKADFYWKQRNKLASIMYTYLNGDITEDNHKEVIDEVYSGKIKCYWMKIRPDGYPKWDPLPPKEIVPEPEKKSFLTKLIGK